MNGVSKALVVMTVLAVPAVGAAQTQPFSYTYVELAYDESDFDLGGGGDVDGDSLTLSGSFEINEDWHAYAAFANSDLDFGIDVDTWTIGAGYRYPLRDDVEGRGGGEPGVVAEDGSPEVTVGWSWSEEREATD